LLQINHKQLWLSCLIDRQFGKLGKKQEAHMLDFGSFGKGGTDHKMPDSRVLQEVRAYWEALREHGRLPPRSAIDPRGLASALEQVFLIERIATGHARFRLAGNLFHNIIGMDVRGMPLTTLLEPVARQRLQSVLEEVFESATVLHLGLEAERSIGRPALRARMMLLPLRAGAAEPLMALGVLAIEGAVGRAPRRFHISTLRSEVVFQSEVVSRILRSSEIQTPGFVEGPVIPRISKVRPKLRLVHSRDESCK
jgi:hypothetical protein